MSLKNIVSCDLVDSFEIDGVTILFFLIRINAIHMLTIEIKERLLTHCYQTPEDLAKYVDWDYKHLGKLEIAEAIFNAYHRPNVYDLLANTEIEVRT